MSSITTSQIKNLIYSFRAHRVMLDSDLAQIYGVNTKVLNQAVSRNYERFPSDFAFRLTEDEWSNLKSQFVTSSSQHGGRRKLPLVFTEQGVAMLSSVLNSKQAIQTNVQIMRTFLQMREMVSVYKDLEKKIEQVEEKSSKNYKIIVQALLDLKEKIEPSLERSRKKIGFKNK